MSRRSGWAWCGVEKRPRPGSGAGPGCSGWGGGAQSVAVASAMAVRADDSSIIDFLVVKPARSAAVERLLIARGMPRAWPWIAVIASSLNRVSLPRPAWATWYSMYFFVSVAAGAGVG